MLELIIVLGVTALAGVGFTPLVIRLAAAWGIYDAPQGDRRVHTEPLPRLGGVAVFFATGVGLLVIVLGSLGDLDVLPTQRSFIFGLIFGGGIIFATGLLDDIRGLRPVVKITAQVVAALLVYGYGFRIDSISFGPSSELSLTWVSVPVTILWIVGVTNAFNLIDGLDGLATGIALVALATTLAVSIVLGNSEVVLLCAALVGSLLGFLRYNFSPAKIFLGDSGSLFIGFMLAVLSVYGSQKSATAVLVAVPLFALAIPLLDTLLAIVRRWLRGVPLSEADGRHIHHRLLALGFTHRHAVLVLYFAAVALAILGLSLVFAPPPAVVSVSVAGGTVIVFALFYGLRRLQYHEFMEAGSVLVSGVARIRRVIRDQINAQDLAQLIRETRTVEELSELLEDSASSFGFLHMEVCKENATGPRPLVLFNGHAARAWKLDYPVTPHDFVDGEDYVLRIWCNPQRGSRPQAAERVAQILARVVEEWMVDFPPPRRARSAAPISLVEDEETFVKGGMETEERTEDSQVVRMERRLSARVVENG